MTKKRKKTVQMTQMRGLGGLFGTAADRGRRTSLEDPNRALLGRKRPLNAWTNRQIAYLTIDRAPRRSRASHAQHRPALENTDATPPWWGDRDLEHNFGELL